MNSSLDLTTVSTTFPELVKPQVPRDNLISYIKDQFSSEQKVIVVQGAVGSGKTTLLAQFAKSFPNKSFSFFGGTTFPTSHRRIFFMDMCDQIGRVLGRPTGTLDQYDTDQLAMLFLDLLRQIGLHSKKHKTEYYLIIDGIEWLYISQFGKDIIDYLPGEPKGHLWVLLSSEVGRTFTFKNHPIRIVFFSQKETEAYLNSFDLKKDEIQSIHQHCQGMPGYLAGLRRLLLSGANFEELNRSLPSKLQDIFLLEWNRIGTITQPFEHILALLTFSSEPLTLTNAAEILGNITPSFSSLESTIKQTSFLRIDQTDGTISFVSDAYKQFVKHQLGHLRYEIEKYLINHYLSNPYSRHSLVLLPQYLASHGDYEQLRSLITTDYVARVLQHSHDCSVLNGTLSTAADLSLEKGDFHSLLFYTMISSILTSLVKQPNSMAEVEALLQLGDYSRALSVAYDSLLIEDRLHLLAFTAMRMQRAGLSVPESVIIELEQMANAVDPTTLKKRAFEIAACLFDLLPEIALKLVERIGIIGNSERSLDLARAMLVLTLEHESEDIVRSRISDQTLRDFASAHSPRIAKLEADEIISQANRISDTSAKVVSLLSWCNEHQENQDSWRVVELALEAITGDSTYAPSMRTLRQLAQAIKPASSHEVFKVIQRLDLLKQTAISSPSEEKIWLELLLARLEGEFDKEQGKTRMLEAYFNVDTLEELDAQCYSLMRILRMAPLVDSSDTLRLSEESQKALKEKFKSLLESSADHEAIANRLLTSLGKSCHVLALEFGLQLNTQRRRDQALQKILSSYVESVRAEVDLSFISNVLRLIKNPIMKQYSRIRLIHLLSETDIFSRISQSRSLLTSIDEVDHPWNKCYALAFSINGMEPSGDSKFIAKQQKELFAEIAKIDTKWDQVNLGYELSSVLGNKAPQISRDLFTYAHNTRTESPLCEEFFASIFIDCLRLTIKLAIIPGDNKCIRSRCDQIITITRQIPSYSTQCILLARLALQLHLSGFVNEFSDVIRQELTPTLDNCNNYLSKQAVYNLIAPALFEYEGIQVFDRLLEFTPSYRDNVLLTIIRYLLSKCQPDDPVNFEKLTAQIDIRTAKRICELIRHLEIDSNICLAMQLLIDSILVISPNESRRERCNSLIEREALDIANLLEQTVQQKLPDQNNINHNGYVVICTAYIARLRGAASHRGSDRSDRNSLLTLADSIPNVADKVLVYSMVSRQMRVQEPLLAEALLRKAEVAVFDIKNPLDRSDRLYIIAETWKKLGKNDAVKNLLRNSMMALGSFPLSKERDDVIGQVLELAHSVDPDFASSLAPMVENPIAEHKASLTWGAKSLQKSPQNILQNSARDSDDLHAMLSRAALDMNAEYHAGTGILPHQDVVLKWIRQMVNAKFDETENVADWALEYMLKQPRRREELETLYHVLVDILKLCINIGNALISIEGNVPSVSTVALPDSLQLFKAGSRKKALLAVQDWIIENAMNYLKVYDAYFTTTELGFLTNIPGNIRVYIITCWKAQKGIRPGDRQVEQLFREAWQRLSDSDPPWTQIVIVGTHSGDSPIHSRFILTEGKGLDLSASLNSLGAKDTDLRELDSDETARIAYEFVDPLLGPYTAPFKGEPLQIHTFIL